MAVSKVGREDPANAEFRSVLEKGSSSCSILSVSTLHTHVATKTR